MIPLQRYKITIAYRGTHYHGWQFQTPSSTWKGKIPAAGRGIPTVQENLQRAIETVVRHEVKVVGASRTDTGVHAKGQVAHFDTDKTQIPLDGLRRSINHQLPDDILIRQIEPVASTFDAILSTVNKRYQYVIWYAEDRPAFFGDLVYHRWKHLDIEAMKNAAASFIGTHNFASFARPGHKRINTIRTVEDCSLSFRSPRIVIGVQGTGFLWNMVRIMVGTIIQIGMGHYPADAVAGMLAEKNRKAAGSTAPASGLYLQWVKTTDVPPVRTRAVAEVDSD